MPASYVVRQAKRLIERGKAEEAAKILSTWLRDHPRDVRARDYLAAAYFEMGAYDEALAALDQVVREWPDKARCWCNYAMVLRKLGRLDEAYEAAVEAAEIDPEYRRAQVELRKIRRLMRLPTCSACGLPIEAADERGCARCGWVYHQWCWEEAGGCINPACGARIESTGPFRPRRTEATRRGCLVGTMVAVAMVAGGCLAIGWVVGVILAGW